MDAKVVLDTAEQNWLAALKKHTEVKEKNCDLNPHSGDSGGGGGGGEGREQPASIPLSTSEKREA